MKYVMLLIDFWITFFGQKDIGRSKKDNATKFVLKTQVYGGTKKLKNPKAYKLHGHLTDFIMLNVIFWRKNAFVNDIII